jgi:hypothetical protein
LNGRLFKLPTANLSLLPAAGLTISSLVINLINDIIQFQD